jgi:membrane protein YqaA with SNARE-associated domain
VLALTGVLTAAGLVGAALSPYLLVKNPLLLVAISPAAHHVALAAATVEPLTLIAVATLRRLLLGICAYGLGYIYGRVSFEWLGRRYPRLGRWLNFVERLFARGGVALLIVAPAQTLVLLAGVARSPLLPFMLALTLGNVIWTTLTYYLGDAIALWTDQLIVFLGDHLIESTALCVAAVVLQQALSRGLAHQRLRQQRTPSK